MLGYGLVCNGCPKVYRTNAAYSGTEVLFLNKEILRGDAGCRGWIYKNGKDYCPECAEAIAKKRKEAANGEE